MLSSNGQGSGQGNQSGGSAIAADSDLLANFPQFPSIASSVASTTTARSSPTCSTDDDTTMKITPVKAPTVRKYHAKQLPRALFRRRSSSGDEASSTTSSSTMMSISLVGVSKPPANHTTTTEAAAAAAAAASTALCSSLPDDLICRVTSFLDVASLLQIRKCSRYLRDLGSRNEAGWENLCKTLWATKVHVPALPSTVTSNYFMEAYHSSIQDAHQRQNLTLDELCYDPEQHTGTIWSFRFKESAGTDWTTADPWHCGLPCRKMVFLKDGSVRQYIPASTAGQASLSRLSSRSSASDTTTTSEESESSLPELISPNFGNLLDESNNNNSNSNSSNNNNNPQQQQHHMPNGRLIPPPLSMSWRLLTRPMDLPTRPVGSYVRFSVGGREVPTYSVRRSPTGNWGFVMESCWGLYASFELPPKQQQQQQRTTTGTRNEQRRRLRRTETGARWVEILENGEETLSNSQHAHGGASSTATRQPRRGDQDAAALMDDASLVITNEIQWREAFLYNVGARILPEGDDATDEFDRAFRGIP